LLEYIPRLAATLGDGGILVLTTAGAIEDAWQPWDEVRQIVEESRLGFAFGDVIGGWNGPENGFWGKPVMGFVKAAEKPMPNTPDELQYACTEAWEAFAEFMNTRDISESERCQAYHRATANAELS
jgi:hypothetical protein